VYTEKREDFGRGEKENEFWEEGRAQSIGL